jgi:hypothetical protein
VKIPDSPYGLVIHNENCQCPTCKPDTPLPPELQREIEWSVSNFTERLGFFRSLSQAGEWIADYRTEITRMVRFTLNSKT